LQTQALRKPYGDLSGWQKNIAAPNPSYCGVRPSFNFFSRSMPF